MYTYCHPATLRVYHYSMANFVYVLVKGMDVTPGGPDESRVPADQRLGRVVELEERVQLLVGGVGWGCSPGLWPKGPLWSKPAPLDTSTPQFSQRRMQITGSH